MISAYDFFNKKMYNKLLKSHWSTSENIPVNSYTILHKKLREERLESLQSFFLQFIDDKFHKFVLYAHNLSSYDGILILESLLYMCDTHKFKLEPIIRDNKIISLKLRFGFINENKYRYYIEFHDSLLLLFSSLEKLSKTFLRDHPDLQKLNNKKVMDLLLYENIRTKIGDLEWLS